MLPHLQLLPKLVFLSVCNVLPVLYFICKSHWLQQIICLKNRVWYKKKLSKNPFRHYLFKNIAILLQRSKAIFSSHSLCWLLISIHTKSLSLISIGGCSQKKKFGGHKRTAKIAKMHSKKCLWSYMGSEDGASSPLPHPCHANAPDVMGTDNSWGRCTQAACERLLHLQKPNPSVKPAED